MPPTLADLRRYAVARSLFPPTTLKRAIERLGFVQADPIRAPARAQDLTLRHRVTRYRAGDLERRYTSLGIEEDFFVNYGYVTREMQAWMGSRSAMFSDTGAGLGRAMRVLQGSSAEGRNALVMYSIVQGDSREAVAKAFEDHPHLQIPEASIEVMELFGFSGPPGA